MRVLLTLVPTLAIAIAPALWHDLFRTYIRSPDPDLIFAYQALALNDGDARVNAEHTGYIYFVILAWTLRAARALGFITADRIGALAGLDGTSFDVSFAQVIFTGRILSMVEAAAFVVLVFGAVRFMSGARMPAALVALLTAGSLGIAIQGSLMRTEFLSALFAYATFVSLYIAARQGFVGNGVWMAVAGLCAALAMAAKVQAIFPLLAIPALMLAMGTPAPRDTSTTGPNERRLALALLMLLTTIVTLPACVMLVAGIGARGSSGLYQSAIALYVCAAFALYRAFYPMPTERWVSGLTALALGFSAGLLVHLIYPNPPAVDAIAAPIEHMMVYSKLSAAPTTGIPVAAMIEIAGNAATEALARRLSLTPIVALEAAIIVGSVMTWRAQDRQTAVGAAAMLGIVLWLETMFGFRFMNSEYLVYTDPWRATALALIFRSLALRFVPEWRRVFAATVFVAVAAIDTSHLSQAFRPDFIRYQPASDACGQAKGYLPKLVHQFAKFCA